MPAIPKVALATALATSLAGGATAFATTTDAPAAHTSYVTIVLDDEAPDEPPSLEGSVPCEAGATERALRALAGRPACTHERYAYAYPSGAPPPWEGDVQRVDDVQHVHDGDLRHAVEITYRVIDSGPEGGIATHTATAGELVPNAGEGDGATYSVPVGHVDDRAHLAVDLGPAPSPTVLDEEPAPDDGPAPGVDADPPAEGT
jgi:hypothetical protein